MALNGLTFKSFNVTTFKVKILLKKFRFFWETFMAILFTPRIFARNLLRERNNFSYFRVYVWPGPRLQRSEVVGPDVHISLAARSSQDLFDLWSFLVSCRSLDLLDVKPGFVSQVRHQNKIKNSISLAISSQQISSKSSECQIKLPWKDSQENL